MVYFHDTNIDKDFKDSVTSKRNGKKKMIIIAIFLLLIIILGIILFFVFRNNDTGYSIILEGDSEISIYQGREYVEFGYHGYDKSGKDVTDLVEVSGVVDIDTVGEYTITYAVGDAKAVRKVKVTDKGVGDTYLYLKGDLTIYLEVGESYVEPGYSVIDTVDGDLSTKMKIDGSVNTAKAGTYKLVYSVVNSAGITTSGTRTVIVLGSEMSLTLSNSSKTTGPVNINVYVNDDYFDYLLLPNGSKVSENKYSYQVKINGTYKFVAYNTRGEKIEDSIKVSNIVIDTGNIQTTPIVKVNTPKVYTSDNIGSGNKHSIGFLLKLTTDSSVIYYCIDSDNRCNPGTKYTGQLWFSISQQKYLRYKACNSNNECSNVGSYNVNLNIKLVNPSVSTSTSNRSGLANPYQVAYYYQADSRWGSYDIYDNNSMAASGCGYNAYAMLLTGLTHDYTITPLTLIKKLKEYRTKYNIEFQTKSQNGALYDHTIHTHSYIKKEYDYDSSKLWRNDEGNIYATAKKEKIVQSLKMGHMIFANVPGHYVAFVGINEKDEIYVFDPSKGTSLQDVDKLYDETYYNYRDKCNTIGRCGISVAYEVYPDGGISLEEWNKIG